MSFYTSLFFSRPRKPPRVTGEALADFLEQFGQLGVLEPNENCWLQLKSGGSIDRDDATSGWFVPVGDTGCISRLQEIEWDVDDEFEGLAPLIAATRAGPKVIYRASVTLGKATHVISDELSRRPSAENKHPMVLWDWHFDIGPVTTHCLGNDDNSFCIGWIDHSLSGNGYLYPWTFADLMERVRNCDELRRVEALCRQIWPVPASIAEPELIAGRRELGELWQYPLDAAPDWAWGLRESG